MNQFDAYIKFIKSFKEILADTLPEERLVVLNRCINYLTIFKDVCSTVLSFDDSKHE